MTNTTEGRRIVLTGATRGLGRAMAEGFIAAGHTVAGCGRSAEAVARLGDTFGPPHDWRAVDVADAGQVDRWASAVLEAMGPPDLLINNAALINAPAPLWRVPADEFRRVIEVNITGTFHVIRAFAPAMIDAGRGVIVNFSSGWGRSTSPEVAPYCATKWAIEGLTSALAQELPAGVAAVALNPGVIDTDMLRTCWGEEAGSYPSPAAWAKKAVPFLLKLGARDNGKAVTVG